MNRILDGLRESGKNALLDWSGFDATHILARASCPGITMTAGGFFVEGVVDYKCVCVWCVRACHVVV